ncbi:MAG TPA: ACT domain-containing protein [Candidatus Marinimicrobia bacterium]|nr:ACT domain-containing protein [Candidatus Neomarinimicrobiota bacterium]
MKELDENTIREIAIEVQKRLGKDATRENIISGVEKVVDQLAKPNPECRPYGSHNPTENPILASDRVIVSVFGRNKPGIIFGVTQVLAENQCDILDISQKFVEDLFYMIMVIDISTSVHDFVSIKERLTERGKELGSVVYVQNEDVFRYVNRI